MLRLRHDRYAFWSAIVAGKSMEAASMAAGMSSANGIKWLRKAGGVIPQHFVKPASGRFLGPMDRATIMVAHRQGQSVRAIAAMLGRSPSTISRELRRNRRAWMPRYHAGQAQLTAEARSRRPQLTKMATNSELREFVQGKLERKWSPEQISHALKVLHPDDKSMQVSTETIYRSIYVQSRGLLRRSVVPHLRTGRMIRKPRKHSADSGRHRHRIPGMVLISERPAEVEDRAVPGHWEGDLIVGINGASQIGTLVERSTRFCVLVHLPISKDSELVADALISTISEFPASLMKTLTWDQGTELSRHHRVTRTTGTDIYFCNPRSPWQRGSNENTNGLLRQYFPKGSNLGLHDAAHLERVAQELNSRPRKTLGWRTPADLFGALLATHSIPGEQHIEPLAILAQAEAWAVDRLALS